MSSHPSTPMSPPEELRRALVIRSNPTPHPNHHTPPRNTAPLLSKRDDLASDLRSLPHSLPSVYDSMPVDKFGLSMLLEMGWKEGDSIGRNKSTGLNKPIQYIPRPERLGLGANPAPANPTTSRKHNKPVYELPTDANGKVKHYIGVDEQFKVRDTLKVRSLVKIVGGQHKDLFGIVSDLFNHKELAVVELGTTGDCVKVNACDLVILSKQQYDRAEDTSRTHLESYPMKPPSRIWVRAGLYVRIVSKTLDSGKHYLRKASILDVLPGGQSVIQVDDSRHTLLERVPQSDLETVVPSVSQHVCIVALSRKAEKPYLLGVHGQVTHKDKAKQQVVVLTTDDEVAVCSFDHVCALAPR